MKNNGSLIDNFLSMPLILKLMVAVGLVSPLLVVFSIVKGVVIPGQDFNLRFGAASNLSELFLVIIFSLPTFLASILIILKYRYSRHIYILGWYCSCLSPLFLSSVWFYMNVFVAGLSFNLLLGMAIFGYLFFNLDVKKYLESGRVSLD